MPQALLFRPKQRGPTDPASPPLVTRMFWLSHATGDAGLGMGAL